MIKKIFIIALIPLAIGAYFAYDKYEDIFSPNVPATLQDPFLLIDDHASLSDVVEALKAKNMILNDNSFLWVAQKMNYIDSKIRAGRFKIKPNWSNRKLVAHLRSGKQAPVKVVLHNARLPEDVAGKTAKFIKADSTQLINLFTDESYLAQIGYTPETLMSLFIPNTYNLYWNTNAKSFIQRMIKENNAFWNKNNRLKKAKQLGLSKNEVYTLASIVEKETNKNDEKPRIAGVYLNRIRKGILLQADPTVVFATREFDLRRVLNKHLNFDSPYNTYMYPGLPPGPISMASISSIDAVLNAEKHDYIFFCAKADDSGYHAFAKTLQGHNQNARKYRKWVSKKLRGK